MLVAIKSGSTAKKYGSCVGMAEHLPIDTTRRMEEPSKVPCHDTGFAKFQARSLATGSACRSDSGHPFHAKAVSRQAW
jgi:hypothetical protein